MSSEVCPFCGKTYKRLKSHLPHCKAAPSSETSSTHHHALTKSQTSSQLDMGATGTVAKGKKSTSTLERKSSQAPKIEKVSAGASLSPEVPLKSTKKLSSAKSSLASSLSSTPSTKKKQKLSDRIKMATALSSPSTQSPSPQLPKLRKQSLRTLMENGNSSQDSEGSASEGLRSGFSPETGSAEQPGTTVNSDSANAGVQSMAPSTDTKPKKASKKKTSNSVAEIEKTSAPPDPSVSDSGMSSSSSADKDVKIEDSSGDEMFWKSGNQQSRITLQDIKSTLGRPKKSRSQLQGWVEMTNGPNRIETGPVLAGGREDSAGRRMSDPASRPKQQPQSGQASSVPANQDVSLQAMQASPVALRLQDTVPSEVSRSPIFQHAADVDAGLETGRHGTGRPSLGQFTHPRLLLPAPQTLKSDDGFTTKTQEVRSINPPSHIYQFNSFQSDLAQRRLGQVTLRELPEWLARRTPGRPREVADLMQRGWRWYYRKYVDVRKGGVAGVAMLLAGYCVLSYIWSFPHLKRDRWRKYH